MPTPPHPTSETVSGYLTKWDAMENYALQERSLNLLFQRHCPKNRQLEDILLKVSALNDFYSTNIYDTFAVAKHIRAINVDDRMKRGDLSLVNEIAFVTHSGGVRKHYSFASKFCNHHFPEHYPIFDSFVEKMLRHYAKTDGFAVIRSSDLKDYERFVEVIQEFQSHYKLRRFSLRELDIFLWLCGKECFPRDYKKK